MSELKHEDRLMELEEDIAAENGVSGATLRRLLAKVDEYGEKARAVGLPQELLEILQDDLREDAGELATMT